GEGNVTTHDSGILARLTPYDGIDHVGRFPRLDRAAGLRVDLSYGGSTLNYNNASVEFIGTTQMDPVFRFQMKGWSAHAAIDLPRWRKEALRSRKRGWLLDVVSPVLSIGKSGTKQVPLLPDDMQGLVLAGDRIRNSGSEITIANIYSIRRGKIDDPSANIQGKTKGWGIGLHLKDIAAFSYDRATVPQAFGLRPVKRKAISLTIQPLEAWKRVHREKK
ncbi:MAG TPA: hypothetical protein VFD83_04440, partial [Candidatus Polarisedimenticolia bacterium]|nr:hypothetical protein [Candidatus Polarisedimenticolia bacterium]